MTAADVLERVDELVDGTGGSVDAVMGAAIGPYRKSPLAIATAAAVLLISFGCVRAQETVGSKALQVRLPRIDANRNLSPAGELRNGVLSVHLEIRRGEWYPEAETGPTVVVQAFAEEGRPLQIPGPLIRVPADTEVQATVRSLLEKGSARVYGLQARSLWIRRENPSLTACSSWGSGSTWGYQVTLGATPDNSP